MAKGFTAKLVGISELKGNLNSYRKEIDRRVDDAIKESVMKMMNDAKSNCKSSTVRGTITSGKEGKNYTVTTSGVLSAYLEFGTGNFAKELLSGYPREWQIMAMNFFVSGLGRMPSQPYLYPAYRTNKDSLILKAATAIETI